MRVHSAALFKTIIHSQLELRFLTFIPSPHSSRPRNTIKSACAISAFASRLAAQTGRRRELACFSNICLKDLRFDELSPSVLRWLRALSTPTIRATQSAQTATPNCRRDLHTLDLCLGRSWASLSMKAARLGGLRSQPWHPQMASGLREPAKRNHEKQAVALSSTKIIQQVREPQSKHPSRGSPLLHFRSRRTHQALTSPRSQSQ